MELRTFFRRDLKKMRGTILCMAVLSMLIVMLGSVTFSIRDGFRSGLTDAFSRVTDGVERNTPEEAYTSGDISSCGAMISSTSRYMPPKKV